MLTNPILVFQASNSVQKWFLYRKHKALQTHFETVLSAFLQIVLQKFGNNRCWPFQFHSSKLQIPSKSGFCAEGAKHSSSSKFCQRTIKKHAFHFHFVQTKVYDIPLSQCVVFNFHFHFEPKNSVSISILDKKKGTASNRQNHLFPFPFPFLSQKQSAVSNHQNSFPFPFWTKKRVRHPTVKLNVFQFSFPFLSQKQSLASNQRITFSFPFWTKKRGIASNRQSY